jgi:hypothetical protein
VPAIIAWTDAQTKMLIKFFNEGHSASVTAKAINGVFQIEKTRNAVIGKWHRMGLIRELTPEQRLLRSSVQSSCVSKPTHRADCGPVIAKRVKILRQLHEEMKQAIQEPPPAPVAVEDGPLYLDLLDVPADGCRFIVSDSPYLYCARPQRPGSSYCQAHHERMYTKTRINLPTRGFRQAA